MILRILEYLGFATKGSRLTHAELDQNFIDLYALQQAALKGLQQYNPATTYPAGSCAVYDGKIWQAGVTATGSWDALKWQEVPTPNAGLGFAAWSNTATYAADAYVEYNLKLYRSLQAGNTGNTPASAPSWWVEVSASTAPSIPNYGDGLYTRGQVVWRLGKAWRCMVAQLQSSGATFEDELLAGQWQPLDRPPNASLNAVLPAGTHTAQPYEELILADTSSGAVTLTLPATLWYRQLRVVNVGTGTLSLQPPAGSTLNGVAAAYTVCTRYVDVWANGDQYYAANAYAGIGAALAPAPQTRQGAGIVDFVAPAAPAGYTAQWSLDNFATVADNDEFYRFYAELLGTYTLYVRYVDACGNATAVATTTATLAPITTTPVPPAPATTTPGQSVTLIASESQNPQPSVDLYLRWSVDGFATVAETGYEFTRSYNTTTTVSLRWEDSNGNTGPISTVVVTVQSLFGNSLVLDGVNDYWQAADAPELNFGTGSFSLSFWYYEQYTAGESSFMNKDTWGFVKNQTGGQTSFALRIYAKPFEGYNGANYLFPSMSLPNNAWSHIALVYDQLEQEVVLYLNGVLYSSLPKLDNRNLDSVFPFQLGNNFFVLKGRLDELLIYNGPRSAADIATLYNSGNYYAPAGGLLTALVARYSFDALATAAYPGPTLADLSGNGNTLTGFNISSNPLQPRL